VRTLAADIGERLGCGAHVTALRRTSVGSLGEADAVTVAQLEGMEPDARRAAVLPMRAALRDYEALTVSGDELRAVGHGRSLGDPDPGDPEGRPVAVLDPDGRLLAVYRRQGAGLRPAVVLA
jgi:tRNA pseudouridine55 synthase